MIAILVLGVFAPSLLQLLDFGHSRVFFFCVIFFVFCLGLETHLLGLSLVQVGVVCGLAGVVVFTPSAVGVVLCLALRALNFSCIELIIFSQYVI